MAEDENDFILTVQKHWQPPLDLIFDFYGSRILVLRHEADRFWLLVHRNPSLVQLTLPSMGGMRDLRVRPHVEAFVKFGVVTSLSVSIRRVDSDAGGGATDGGVDRTVFEIKNTHDKLNALAVGLFPGLTQFKIEMLSPEVKEALWKHCYNLELIDAANEEDCVAIHAWMERRRQDARLVDN
ncbi:hypothetical protein FBU30_010110 [Linnemannia zychae]|nr:hypothetical protein FBU30_010110 [Linnemannia zychae]